MIDHEADFVVVTDGMSFAEVDYVDAGHNGVGSGYVVGRGLARDFLVPTDFLRPAEPFFVGRGSS